MCVYMCVCERQCVRVCLSPGSHVAVPGGPCGPMLTPALVPGEAVGEGVCGGQRYHPHFFCVSLFLLSL